MAELIGTVPFMTSKDYRKRFIAEYQQTRIRYEKLCAMVAKYKAGTLGFEPKCPIGLLMHQCQCMCEYLVILENRAEYEGIDLGFKALKGEGYDI